MSTAPAAALSAVHQKSEVDDKEPKVVIKGCDFSEEITLEKLVGSMMTTGFQATNVGLAVEEINRMLAWRSNQTQEEIAAGAEVKKCTIFLAYTSNMISCGVRETIKFLVKNKLVDVVVTTAGGIEEDFIKCLAPTLLGDFKLKGRDLRLKGLNRIGNLIVPNANYCLFEDWLNPILHTMTDEQVKSGVRWSPSSIIRRLGKEINHEDSVYYWAYKNDVPVFCPAITDGSLGDMLYFFNYRREEFVCDIVQDIRKLNDIAVRAACTGQIILGGGIIKHHTCNANLMRNGAEHSVFINTGQEFDGSDSGASPDEAISWGKIKIDARPVKVAADATLVFPLIVSQTFAKEQQRRIREGDV